LHVAIAGKPNAGKSSLLNSLTKQPSAIVTDIAGTTRDILKETIQIDGLPLHIIDTAGLHNSDDIIEKEGIRRAHAEIDSADVVLLVYEAQEQSADYSILSDLMTNKPIVTIRNKIDLLGEEAGITEQDKQFSISLSAKTGNGVELLRELLIRTAGYNPVGEEVFLARKRHLLAIASALKYIKIAVKQLESGASELVAEDLRQASMSLGAITGEFSSDDLLGEIFSSFCIGK
jgi:tRNA modification GTPase